MHTGSKFASFAPDQLVELEDLQDRFFDYLDDQAKDLASRVYDGPGVFGTTLGFDLTTPGEFDITGSSLATDGIGHLLDVTAAIAYCQDVSYEDSPAIPYEVSLRWSEGPWVDAVENTIRNNADTGAPEYIARMNFIGEAGEPDDVQIVGDDIVFTIDTLCEAGVSHAGRFALVYLVNAPQASTSAIALPILTVAFSGGLNKITVVSNKLGQSIVSTNTAHYRVIVLGPTVRRNSSKLGVSGYVVLGTITDDDADTSAQNLINISLSNINDAFNNFAQAKPIIASSAGPKDPLPVALWATSSVEYDGSIITFGGSQSFPLQNVNSSAIYAYDPAIDSWAVKAAVFADAFTAQVATCRVGDIVYVAGGHNGATVSNLLRRYDANADAFLGNGATMPAGRHGGALVALGDYLYYIGGDIAIPTLVSAQVSVYRYSIDTDQWSAVASLPTAKARVNAVVSGSKIFVLGGATADLFNSVESYCYDPSTNAWESLADEPDEIVTPFATYNGGPFRQPAVALINGAVHLVSGSGQDSGAYSFHHVYSIQDDSWAVLPAPKLPNTYATTHGAVDGVLYMFGGVVRNGASSFAVISRGFAANLSTVSAAVTDGCAVDAGDASETPSSFSTEFLSTLTDLRAGHSICKLGSGYLISGGFDSISGTYTASCEMFWPETRTLCNVANMPDPRALHGSTQYGHRAVILSGNIEEDVGDRRVWAFNPYANSWTELASPQAGPSRSKYAMVVDGSIVYFIGGYNHDVVPVELDTVEAFDLASLRSHGTVATLAAAAGAGSAALLDDIVYHATSTVIQATKLSKLDDAVTSVGVVKGVTLPAVVQDGGLAIYNGSLYIYEPTNSRILRYDPRDYTFEIVATGLISRYRAAFFVQNGRAYIMGGSTTSGLTVADDTVQEIVLPSVPYSETPNVPSNFSTGKRGDSVGFRAGQIYGSIGWDRFDSSSFTRMTIAL